MSVLRNAALPRDPAVIRQSAKFLLLHGFFEMEAGAALAQGTVDILQRGGDVMRSSKRISICSLLLTSLDLPEILRTVPQPALWARDRQMCRERFALLLPDLLKMNRRQSSQKREQVLQHMLSSLADVANFARTLLQCRGGN